jgi:hypothetical protein
VGDRAQGFGEGENAVPQGVKLALWDYVLAELYAAAGLPVFRIVTVQCLIVKHSYFSQQDLFANIR